MLIQKKSKLTLAGSEVKIGTKAKKLTIKKLLAITLIVCVLILSIFPYPVSVPRCKKALITVPFHTSSYVLYEGQQDSYWFGLYAEIQYSNYCKVIG